MWTFVASVKTGTIVSSSTSIDNALKFKLNIKSSRTESTLIATRALAASVPSDTWMVAVQLPKISVLACSTSPSIVTSTVCASVPSTTVASLPKTISGVAVNNCNSLSLRSLTDNVSSSPSGSVMPVARVMVSGPGASSSIVWVPAVPIVGGSLGITSTATVPITVLSSGVFNTTPASQVPDMPGFNTPPRKTTAVDFKATTVDAPPIKTTTGVEVNKARVSLTVFVNETSIVSPSMSLTPVATVNTGTNVILSALPSTTVSVKSVATVCINGSSTGVTSMRTTPTSTSPVPSLVPSLNCTTASHSPLACSFNTPSNTTTGDDAPPEEYATIGAVANKSAGVLTGLMNVAIISLASLSMSPTSVATVNAATVRLLPPLSSSTVSDKVASVKCGGSLTGVTSMRTMPTSTSDEPSLNCTTASHSPLACSFNTPPSSHTGDDAPPEEYTALGAVANKSAG